MPTVIDNPKQEQHVRVDQASALRMLVARSLNSFDHGHSVDRRCRTILLWGGKGGVGHSVIATNLAIAFGQLGQQAGLVDASPDFGNVELLCGLNGYWNLSHVAHGCRELDDVLKCGPSGVRILAGASCLTEQFDATKNLPAGFSDRLQSFERELDWIIVDGSGASSDSARRLAQASDDVLIITNGEPTGVAEAYASVKSLANIAGPRLGLLVNPSDSPQQSEQILDRLQQAAHSFLKIDLHRRGFIPRDKAVSTSVQSRVPFVMQSPDGPATAALKQLARRWTRRNPADNQDGFFSRLCFKGGNEQ